PRAGTDAEFFHKFIIRRFAPATADREGVSLRKKFRLAFTSSGNCHSPCFRVKTASARSSAETELQAHCRLPRVACRIREAWRKARERCACRLSNIAGRLHCARQ